MILYFDLNNFRTDKRQGGQKELTFENKVIETVF